MVATITITIDPGAVQRLTNRGGAIDTDLQRRALRGLQTARLRAPVDTGRLRASGLTEPTRGVPGAWDIVFPVNYAWFVDQGTRFMVGRPYLSGVLPTLV